MSRNCANARKENDCEFVNSVSFSDEVVVQFLLTAPMSDFFAPAEESTTPPKSYKRHKNLMHNTTQCNNFRRPFVYTNDTEYP